MRIRFSNIVTSLTMIALELVILILGPGVIFNDNFTDVINRYGTIGWYIYGSIIGLFIVHGLLYYIFKKVYDNRRKLSKLFIAYIFSISIISGGTFTLIPYLLNRALAGYINMNPELIIFFFASLLLYAYDIMIVKKEVAILTNQYIYDVRRNIVSRLSECKYETYENLGYENIYTCINNDTENISNVIDILMSGLTSLVVILCCSIYLIYLNFQLSVCAIMAICILVAAIILFSKFAQSHWNGARESQNVYYSFLNSFIKGFANLSVNKRKVNEFLYDMENVNDQYKEKRINAEKFNAYSYLVSETLIFTFLGAIIVVPPVFFSKLDLGDISEFFVIFLMLKGQLDVVINAINKVPKIIVSRKKIKSLMGILENAPKQVESQEMLSTENMDELEFNNICFSYKNDNDKLFGIGPVSFKLKKGEITFIIGGNGSGKSTLGKLITGLYTADSGEIFYNGEKVNNVRLLSECISPIFADGYLFKKLYGIDNIDQNKIDEVLHNIKLDQKISIKDRIINNTNLSSGQKKRVALLVSYLENAQIYFFDEWAAEQDPEFKQYFYNELLHKLKKEGKCVIVITHDDRYFDVADQVIKMEDGILVV